MLVSGPASITAFSDFPGSVRIWVLKIGEYVCEKNVIQPAQTAGTLATVAARGLVSCVSITSATAGPLKNEARRKNGFAR